MRIAVFLTASLTGFLLAGVTAAQSPEDIWKAEIADQNMAYSKTPHAMLKIQDSVYLHDGDQAALQGQKGKPGSYHWSHDPNSTSVLIVSIHGGKIAAIQNGKTIDPNMITKSIAVDKDVDIAGQPTQVAANVNGWRVFVYNQKNPAALNFTSVSYFPYDAAYRVTAHFKADPKLPPRVFRTSRGTQKQFYHAGDASFVLQGKSIALPFYSDSNDPKQIRDMSAFFIDDLTGKGAYGAGRYVDISDFGKFPPATATINFNEAYNPNCARSAHFTCPDAIDAVPMAMKAGERDPHMAH